VSRDTPGWRNARAVVGLLVLFSGVVFTSPRWSALFRATAPTAPEDEAGAGPVATPTPDAPADASRSIQVRLLFPAADRNALLIEERAVAYDADLARQLEQVVTALATGSRAGHLPALPPGTRVLQVLVDERGTAFVDLSKDAAWTGIGALEERLAVYALVDTLSLNFPAVRRVQWLVEDKPVETMAGHVDLSRPLRADMTLIAEPEPSPTPDDAGPGAPAAVASPTESPR
jgi:hypothetical protein